MRTTRKLLALLLAVAMVFTMTAMTALATGGDDGTTTPDNGTTKIISLYHSIFSGMSNH